MPTGKWATTFLHWKKNEDKPFKFAQNENKDDESTKFTVCDIYIIIKYNRI